MKDSRLGSYGALALWFALTLKFVALWQMTDAVLAILVAHPLSRLASTMMMQLLPYVSVAGSSKSRPIAEKQSSTDTLISMAIGGSALLLIANPLMMVLSLVTVVGLLAFWFKRQIGGFTGDTLGATQQLAELAVYLCLLATGGGL
jgi:adenosylcobinamide-GDP ribazoletransferase